MGDQRLENFYERLRTVLRHPVVRNGDWRLLECAPAWDGNSSWNAFMGFAWQNSGGERLLVAVNYAPHPSQCYVRIPFPDLGGRQWQLQNLLSETHYDRDGDGLQSGGLYLDVAPWQYHVFQAKHG